MNDSYGEGISNAYVAVALAAARKENLDPPLDALIRAVRAEFPCQRERIAKSFLLSEKAAEELSCLEAQLEPEQWCLSCTARREG